MEAKWAELKLRAEQACEEDSFAESESLWWLALREAEDVQSVQLVCLCLDGLADLFLKQHRYPEAESLYRESLNKKADALGEKHAVVGRACNSLAHVLYRDGKYVDAEALLKRALNNLKQSTGLESPEAQWCGRHLMRLLRELGRNDEAAHLSKVMQEVVPVDLQVVTGSKIQAICEVCHHPYKGQQCLRCTQRGMASLRSLGMQQPKGKAT
jgi:tetratricopeptide (TPR) repeat protein